MFDSSEGHFEMLLEDSEMQQPVFIFGQNVRTFIQVEKNTKGEHCGL